MNREVSFEVAKLLKQVGYNLYHRYSYWKGEITSHTPGYALEDGTTSQENYWEFERYYAPSIADVVMWLYKTHGVWIFSKKEKALFQSYIQYPKPISNWFSKLYDSPDQAYEVAIKQCLTTLLKLTCTSEPNM